MESFTVQCSTCQSRIRVRNISLIGQLVHCPKCRAIVQITNPSAAPSPGTLQAPKPSTPLSPADSKAVTSDGIEEQDFNLLETEFSEAEDFRLLPIEAVDVPQNPKPNFSQSFHGDFQDHLDGSSIAAPPVQWSPTDRASPSQEWTSEITNKKRQVLLVSAIGLSSLMVTGACFAFFLRWVNQSESVEVVGALQDTSVDPQLDPTFPPEDPAAQDIVSTQAEDELTQPLEPLNLDSLSVSDGSLSESKDHQLTSSPPDAQSGDQLLTGGEQENLENGSTGETIDDQVASVALPNRLRELAELIGQPFEFSVPQTLAIPDKAPVTAEELGIAAKTLDKSLPPIDLHAVSNERRMSGFRLDNISLPNAVNYLSLASGIPMTLDANSLLSANLDRKIKLNLRLDDMTVREGLQKFALQSNLQLQAVENRYFRLFSKQPTDQQLPFQISISDLATDEGTVEWLRSLVDQYFPTISDGITAEGPMLTAQREKVDVPSWFVLVRALENWRTHRGLPSALPQYLPENLLVPFVLQDQVAGLQRPLQRMTTSPQPLASLLTSLGTDCDIDCWIDWPSLATIGLSPSTLISTTIFNRTLKSILQELAFEYGLVTVIVDQNTIWLTSKETYRHSPDLFVIASEGRAMEYWEQYFRPLTPVLSGGISKTQLLMTSDGSILFVKSCRPTLDFN